MNSTESPAVVTRRSERLFFSTLGESGERIPVPLRISVNLYHSGNLRIEFASLFDVECGFTVEPRHAKRHGTGAEPLSDSVC